MRGLTRCLLLGILLLGACKSRPDTKTLRLATTTSVKDSGLLDVVVAALEKKGVTVTVSAVGSGQALEMLDSGKADVAITHAPDEERALVESGAGVHRTPFMKNDFVIVGPADADVVIAGSGSAREAMRRIAVSGKPFISRGDKSGTHQRELELWRKAGVSDTKFVVVAGAGMGATLARAAKEQAFTLTDRGTYLAKRGEVKLSILFQGDPELENVYSLIEPAQPSEATRTLAKLLRSPEGKTLIGGYGVARFGEPLFTPID